jgi:hypothetical protein
MGNAFLGRITFCRVVVGVCCGFLGLGGVLGCYVLWTRAVGTPFCGFLNWGVRWLGCRLSVVGLGLEWGFIFRK